MYGTGIPLSGTSLVVLISYQEENPGGAGLMQKTSTWTQDAAGNAYVGTVASTINPGTASAVTSQTVQTLDTYGNLIQQQLYDYPGNPAHSDTTTPYRTYNFTYLTDSELYFALHPQPADTGHGDRLRRHSISGYRIPTTAQRWGRCSIPRMNNGTNGPCCHPTPVLHDASYGTSFTYRGNATSSWQFGTTTNAAYLITGVPYKMQDGAGMVVNVATDATTAYSLPSVVTPNSNSNLATSMTYSGSFTLSSVTGPNGDTQSIVSDAFNRPGTVTSADGAVTQYTYTYTTPGSPGTPNTQTANISSTTTGTTTTLPQCRTTTFDGFGRPVRVTTGHDGVAVSYTDTKYGPCGCSPLGKVTAVSMPYAPGATVYWTTYTYDGSGRTLTEAKPDGSVTTTSYAGNAVTTTDPASKWKTYYSDSAIS